MIGTRTRGDRSSAVDRLTDLVVGGGQSSRARSDSVLEINANVFFLLLV